MNQKDLTVVVLAAGKGTRMHSSKPKILHHIGGKPMLLHVVELAATLSDAPIKLVVNAENKAELQQLLAKFSITWIVQEPQLGTGDAVLQAIKGGNSTRVLTLFGDVPLISLQTIEKLLQQTPPADIGVLTAKPVDPSGLGRIIRDATGNVVRIVEEKDATPEERQLNEINTGIFCLPGQQLLEWLTKIKSDNAQHEYYLTDVIAIARAAGVKVKATIISDCREVLGVNNKVQQAACERAYQQKLTQQLMLQGVTLMDPARVDIRGQLQAGRDVTIDVNTIFEGDVVLADGVTIGANCCLRNVKLGRDVVIKSHSVLEDCSIEQHAVIGPFARIRPGTVVQAHAHVGNFVEIKNSTLAAGVKACHLSYIGDAYIGESTNVGAGTITANYDGVNKHKTYVGKHARLGSNSVLVAPVDIGDNATIGAGSVITKMAPASQLTLTRPHQRSIPTWKRPEKNSPEKKDKAKE